MTIQKKRSGKIYIDLTGPDGNVFHLIGVARQLAKTLGHDADAITSKMMEGDYEHAIKVLDEAYGSFIVLER